MTNKKRNDVEGLEGGEGLLSVHDLDAIEREFAGGMTQTQITDLFQSRGVKFSEASFRKYVQLGLLPRSRRVGRKGKHQGSMGLYPATTVRRVNAIKQMMAESYTIEEIQRSFLRFTDQVEAIERGLTDLMSGFERELKSSVFGATERKGLTKQVEDARRAASELVERIEGLERQIVSPLERAARARAFSTGVSGGAGDLL